MSQIETPICSHPTTTHHFIYNDNRSATIWADHRWNAEWLEKTTRLRTFISDIGTHPPRKVLPRTAWVPLSRSPHQRRTFPLPLTQMTHDPFCVLCGAEEQIVDHVVIHCPIHRPPCRVHGPTVLDNETIE